MSDPITPRHAAAILARASAVDFRDPSAAADEVWADALTRAGVDFRDCLDAVAVHYARSAERLMPAHVIAAAQELARDRVARERSLAAIAAASRPGALPPGELHRRLDAAITAARAAKAERERDPR